MAHETDADGCPKTHPDGIEKEEAIGRKRRSLYPYPMAGQKSRLFSISPLSGQGLLAERMKTYRADYLSRREYVHRKQTYISYETYRRLARMPSPAQRGHDRTGIP